MLVKERSNMERGRVKKSNIAREIGKLRKWNYRRRRLHLHGLLVLALSQLPAGLRQLLPLSSTYLNTGS
jgi:hypothetical protein